MESIVAVDMVLKAGLVRLEELAHYVEGSSGAKGVKRLRRAVGLAEPRSESPMETRLRLELIRARLPRPEAQVNLYDRSGRFLARADLYYSDVRLVIEFDGQNHRDRLIQDVQRQNGLLNADYHLLRFTVADLNKTGEIVSKVRQARAMLLRKLR